MTTLKERDLLLEEIKDRPRNTLEVISRILSHESKGLEDEKAVRIFNYVQERIKSISLVHEKVYRAKNLRKIDFSYFARSLTKQLFSQYGRGIENIRLRMDISDVYLDIQRAIPCGMILHELITNSLKHAFPGSREGEIHVTLEATKSGKNRLAVADDGIGFPEGLDYRRPDTVGMKLVIGFVKQIKGRITLRRKGGTEFIITF
ncbi:MAG: sensor histidine kinase [Candidatus Aminicenantales bacterium]